MRENDLEPSFISDLLGQEIASWERIGGGRNSQVYHLTSKTPTVENQFVVKRYFRCSVDPRDRLGVEFSSLKFIWENGLRCIPQPILASRQHACAIYEFIEGKKLSATEIGEAEIDQAVQFLAALQELKTRPGSESLTPASEACFSIQAILKNIEMRLARLSAVGYETSLHAEMHAFLDEKLRPTLIEASQRCYEGLAQLGKTLETELTQAQRILSPSDFGFHNALQRSDGQLVFLDFEYFGWDDPAKTIADFLLHPNPIMDLPSQLKAHFAEALLTFLAADQDLPERLRLVFPLFGIKWCLILLNEFLDADYQRRSFANEGMVNRNSILVNQLSQAIKNYDKIMPQLCFRERKITWVDY